MLGTYGISRTSVSMSGVFSVAFQASNEGDDVLGWWVGGFEACMIDQPSCLRDCCHAIADFSGYLVGCSEGYGAVYVGCAAEAKFVAEFSAYFFGVHLNGADWVKDLHS